MHKLEFQMLSEAPPDWDDFVLSCSGSVFQQALWARVLQQGYHSKAFYFAGRLGGRLVIGTYGTVFDFWVFRFFYSAVPYGGLVGNLQFLPEFLTFVESGLKRQGIDQIRITKTAAQVYPEMTGFNIQQAFQHELDLRGLTPDSLWEGYRKNTRRDVNRARKSGITIRELTDRTQLDDYYGLYQKTMRRNAALCHYTRRLYDVIYDDLITAGKASILFADFKGKIIGGVLLIHGREKSYLLGSVSDPDYLKLCPNDLLYQASLEKTFSKGLHGFDFMMSEKEDTALMRFKEKWGAEPLNFFIYQKDLRPWRCALWRAVWSFANTRCGAALARFVSHFK